MQSIVSRNRKANIETGFVMRYVCNNPVWGYSHPITRVNVSDEELISKGLSNDAGVNVLTLAAYAVWISDL